MLHGVCFKREGFVLHTPARGGRWGGSRPFGRFVRWQGKKGVHKESDAPYDKCHSLFIFLISLFMLFTPTLPERDESAVLSDEVISPSLHVLCFPHRALDHGQHPRTAS